MSMFKRTKVVMLPTKEISNVVKIKYNLFFTTSNLTNHLACDYQHLYFLSDDEIKDGDWFINELNELWRHNGIINPGKFCKKIIATTDRSLTPSIFEGPPELVPEPSQGFIKKYCEKGGIDEVMVEYEEYNPNKLNEFTSITAYRLKVASDNTITIRPVKDSWTRQEVENLILQFANDAIEDEDLLHHYGGVFKDAKQWIKENL